MSNYVDKPWIPQESVSLGADLMPAFGIIYYGTTAYGKVDVDGSGDMLFTDGAAGADIATHVNPAGDTTGKLDLYGGTDDLFPTFKTIMDMVNASGDFWMWLIGARPEQVAHVTTTGHVLDTTTQDVGGTASSNILTGSLFYFDNDQADLFGVGLTRGGPPHVIHNSDSGVEWKATRVSCKSTDASDSTATLKLYACNDQAGTSRVLKTFIPGATTVEVLYPAAATPATEAHGVTLGGERMVLTYVGGGALTGTGVLDLMTLAGEYRIVSPIMKKSRANPELIR